jgi:hypothetical protein
VREHAQALAETREARQRLLAAAFFERAVGAQACGEAHAVAQAVDDAQIAVLVTCDDEVKTVRAEVDSGKQFAVVDLRCCVVRHASLQTVAVRRDCRTSV